MRPTSSLAGVVLLASIFFVGATAPPSGQLSGVNQSSNTAAVPNRRVHTVGDVWMSIGSDGEVGGQYGASGADPDSIAEIESSFEFPGGTQREHLYGSGLWIGGLVGGVDTVVMSAMFANSGPNPVFTPTKPMETYYDSARGHQYFVAQYADTAMNFNRYPADHSLGVEIRQTSHAFESRPYDRFVLVEYLIRNISPQTIYKAYVGFFADPDVFHELRSGQPEGEASDDITGFLRERGIAYTIDNDGDAASVSDSLFSRNWCPSGFGLAPVMMDPLPACTSFNWRATNFGNVDWGPSRMSSPFGHHEDPTLPYGMNGMYRTMANSEIDYDQIEAAIDKRDEGWRRPAIAQADNIANGLDTRWTLSFCFGDLAPYDSLRIIMAYVAGDSIHRIPGRYPNPQDPDKFLVGLDFSDLRRNVDLARLAWSQNHELYGAAPARLTVTPVADDAVECQWTPAPFSNPTGYVLYQRVSGVGDWTEVAHTGWDRLVYGVTGLIPGVSYEFAVSSLDGAGVEGARSRPITMSPGYPTVVPSLTGRTTPQATALSWAIPNQLPGLLPLRFVNIYRRASDLDSAKFYVRRPIPGSVLKVTGASGVMDRFGMETADFIDDSVTAGHMYRYSVSVTNALGFEGPRSGELNLTPLTLDRPGVVLYNTRRGIDYLVNYDSVRAFYDLWAVHYGFDTIEMMPVPYPSVDTVPRREVLARYRCVIIVNETQYGQFPRYQFEDWLDSYATNGGKCIFVTRNHAQSSVEIFPDRSTGAVHWMAKKLLGIWSAIREGCIYPNRPDQPGYIAARFVGAKSATTHYPDLDADSAAGMNQELLRLYISVFHPPMFIAGYVPAVGALDSVGTGTEVLYRYVSAYDTSIVNNKPIAVKRITDSTAAILFNFPLSLMKREQAWQALTQAVVDLGIDTINYWSPPPTSTRSIIEWLYGHSSAPPDPAWDINHDGVIDIRDVVEQLNR